MIEKGSEMTAFAFKLPVSLLEQLHEASRRRGITSAGYLRMVLLENLGKEERDGETKKRTCSETSS